MGCFHHVKIMHTMKGPMREGTREEVIFLWEESHPFLEPGLVVVVGRFMIPQLHHQVRQGCHLDTQATLRLLRNGKTNS